MHKDIITGGWMTGFSTPIMITRCHRGQIEASLCCQTVMELLNMEGKMTQTVCNELSFHSLSTKAHLWIVNDSEMDEPN